MCTSPDSQAVKLLVNGLQPEMAAMVQMKQKPAVLSLLPEGLPAKTVQLKDGTSVQAR